MSMRLNIRADGIKQYAKKLKNIGKAVESLDKPMKEAGQIALAAVRSYPPYTESWKGGTPSFSYYRPGSKYRRTKTLQEGWRGRITKGSKIVVRYSVTNHSVAYMRYVMGDSRQNIHAPWWHTLDEWDEILKPYVFRVFQDFMKKETR